MIGQVIQGLKMVEVLTVEIEKDYDKDKFLELVTVFDVQKNIVDDYLNMVEGHLIILEGQNSKSLEKFKEAKDNMLKLLNEIKGKIDLIYLKNTGSTNIIWN